MKDDLLADLAALRALEAAATKGPWQSPDGGGDGDIWDTRDDDEPGIPLLKAAPVFRRQWGRPIKDGEYAANAALIVAARNALPAMLTHIEQLTAEIERLMEVLAWCHEQASDAMLVSAGAATANGDPDGALEMLNRIASDIAANAEAALAVRTLLTKEQ